MGFANEAVKALFALCEVPDSIMTELLNKLLLKTFPPKQGDLLDNMEDAAPAPNVRKCFISFYDFYVTFQLK